MSHRNGKTKIILLIGEMGSGKSHLGRGIARDLDYLFIEGDELARPEIRQLRSRPEGWRWVKYWLLNKPFFQRPRGPHTVLINSGMP